MVLQRALYYSAMFLFTSTGKEFSNAVEVVFGGLVYKTDRLLLEDHIRAAEAHELANVFD
ncbi:hypothetical protein RRF57_009181 [Xylaria bambusicola]|uniref:Uncharacterized protein n=1 Tax=Xylaria bambusicola TaxID=326684 RepID=A0AAN7Z7N3_9PEZI